MKLVAVAVPLLVVIASCAGTGEEKAYEYDGSAPIPPPVDASTDVIDAGDVPSCAESDFCPVSSAIDPRYVLTSIWGANANDIWAVGSGGTIVHWDGAAWKTIPSGTSDTLNAVWGSGPRDIWIAGSTASILHGSGSGQWESVPVFIDAAAAHGRMHAVWGANAFDVRVGGQPFECVDCSDGGSGRGNSLHRRTGPGWTLLDGLAGKYRDATVRAIWGTAANDLWISLDNGVEQPWARGTLVHGTAAGDALVWTAIDSQSTAPLESLWGSSASDVWAVGGGGTIRRFAAGAKRWALVQAPTTAALHAVWGTASNDVWVVGDAGTILHYDGAAWTRATVAFPLGRKPRLTGVWGSGPNDVWVVGEAFALHFTGKKAAR